MQPAVCTKRTSCGSRPYCSCEQCSALPSSRMSSRTVQPQGVGEKGPASAGLTSLKNGAAPYHSAECDHVLRSRQCVRKGPAVPAGLTLLTNGAAPCHSAECEHVLCSRQGVRNGQAASAGLTALTSEAAPCHRAGCEHVLCSCQGVRNRGQQRQQALHLLWAMQRHAIAPGVSTHSGQWKTLRVGHFRAWHLCLRQSYVAILRRGTSHARTSGRADRQGGGPHGNAELY